MNLLSDTKMTRTEIFTILERIRSMLQTTIIESARIEEDIDLGCVFVKCRNICIQLDCPKGYLSRRSGVCDFIAKGYIYLRNIFVNGKSILGSKEITREITMFNQGAVIADIMSACENK